MLSAKRTVRKGVLVHAGERGLVLIMVMIVLVAMMFAGVAMLRSVDTANLVAGNMSFRQAATHQGDIGVEAAVLWLQNNNGTSSTVLQNNVTTQGYRALVTAIPPTTPTWDKYWATLDPSPVARPVSTPTNSGAVYTLATNNNYTVSYFIQRMCNSAGAKANSGCISSPTSSLGTGNSFKAGTDSNFSLNSQVYYRITARIEGPRNTISYVQAMVAM